MAQHDPDHDPVTDHPALNGLSAAAREAIQRDGHRMTLAAGTRVFGPGERCEGLPLMLTGEVRVQMTGASGNEIVLYRIKGGEMCPLSLACLLAAGNHQSEAIVETDAQVLLLPARLTERLMNEEAAFRKGVLESYGQRLQSLMLVIEEVAFQRMDRRLAERLLQRQHDGRLNATHQDLAVELGTAREVVSRLLKEFERRGCVHLERGLIEIQDDMALREMAGLEPPRRSA